jgi:osmotically-inducible protein OsmY
MKSDAQLKTDLEAELDWEPVVDDRNFAVAVKDGIVTIRGTVDSYLKKRAAEQAVRRVEGVRGMASEVEVRLAPEHQRSDTEIAQAAVTALRWHSLVPEDRVKVEVDNGWVTITGDLDWQYQLAGAEQSVQALTGVRGVSNLVGIRRPADVSRIRENIASALLRHAARELRHIAIRVDGSVVTLEGPVKSLSEHDAIVGTAFATHGVTRVIDRLEVEA